MAISIKSERFGQWDNCMKLDNGLVELFVSIGFGPRILRYAFCGGKNLLAELPDTVIETGGEPWRMYGGHRLWHSPESMPRTYELDNSPVEYEILGNGIRIIQPVEPHTGIEKQMEITLDERSSNVRIMHRMTNRGLWPMELALWGITVMSQGGMAVVPQPKRDTGLLGNRMLMLWPYTDMTDPRVTWGRKFIYLRQDPGASGPIKFGLSAEDGWAAYLNHECAFIKYFVHDPDMIYPDNGCSFESYTNAAMLEMESLSPLRRMAPGESLKHLEKWSLHKLIHPGDDEDAMEGALTPLL